MIGVMPHKGGYPSGAKGRNVSERSETYERGEARNAAPTKFERS